MKRQFGIWALAATFALAALPGGAFDLSAMTDGERQSFRDEVRAYLMDNPEVLIEAIGVLEERKAAAQVQGDAAMILGLQDELFNDGYSFVGGNPDGDITIVEFLDYRCGYCRRAHPEVAELVKSDGNIRYIIKEFPILGDDSAFASRFALATMVSSGRDAYYAVHNALMAHNGAVNEAAMRRVANSLSLNADAILAQMDTPVVSQMLARNRQLGSAMQITGTPSFVMGDEMLRGYVPLDGMREIVAALREG